MEEEAGRKQERRAGDKGERAMNRRAGKMNQKGEQPAVEVTTLRPWEVNIIP